jgi:hypothetical protein
MANSSMTGFYAALIGLSALGIISTLFLIGFNKYSCRFLLYFVCFIFVFIGFIAFIVVTVASVAAPLVYFACDFTTTGLSSKSTFMSKYYQYIDEYAPILDKNVNRDFSSTISKCLPGGTGDVVDTSSLNSQLVFLELLNNISESATSFN